MHELRALISSTLPGDQERPGHDQRGTQQAGGAEALAEEYPRQHHHEDDAQSVESGDLRGLALLDGLPSGHDGPQE